MKEVKREIRRLMRFFPSGFINHNFELVLVPKTNLYFRLEDVKTLEDLQFKIIAWCSRDASKAQPYRAEHCNEKYRKRVRDGINEFLGTDFNASQWMDIYTKFGNACYEDRCREFIRSGFDFNLVNKELKQANTNITKQVCDKIRNFFPRDEYGLDYVIMRTELMKLLDQIERGEHE